MNGDHTRTDNHVTIGGIFFPYKSSDLLVNIKEKRETAGKKERAKFWEQREQRRQEYEEDKACKILNRLYGKPPTPTEVTLWLLPY